MFFLYWQHLIICEICYMCPLTNCHIWLIFATPLMGDEPPPPEWQSICVLTHTWRILGLPSGPHQYLCVVCLKTFRIGLSNFAYLSHIIHITIFPILANLCGLPSHHTAGFPTSKAISPNPRPANSQKSVWKKEQIFSFR